jgi:hypothetical protein
MTSTASFPPGVADRVAGNEHAPRAAGVVPPRRRVRLPQVAIGLLVTLGFALAALLVHLGSMSRVPALAVAGDVDRGDVITESDISVVHIASEGGFAHLGQSDLGRVVGQTALVDLRAGTLLTTDVVAAGAALDEGQGIVGLLLDAGQYPTSGITAGDTVHVVSSASEAAEVETEPTDPVIARDAIVSAVEELSGDQRLVSIMADEADAAAVAAAAGAGSLRLVMVSR